MVTLLFFAHAGLFDQIKCCDHHRTSPCGQTMRTNRSPCLGALRRDFWRCVPVSDGREPGGTFGRIFRSVRLAFIGGAAKDRAAADEKAAASETAVAADASAEAAPNPGELINEGLRQRQRAGSEAARPYFERAAELEPNSPVPWFMLGNVASELGNLDVAVAHYAHARDLNPSDHVIRYNLGLNQLSRGYIDAAIEELRAACGLNPSYLQAQSSHILALHSSDRISPEEIAATIREWGARFSLEHPASATERPGASQAERLRVGFVSADLRTHSVAHFIEPILS